MGFFDMSNNSLLTNDELFDIVRQIGVEACNNAAETKALREALTSKGILDKKELRSIEDRILEEDANIKSLLVLLATTEKVIKDNSRTKELIKKNWNKSISAEEKEELNRLIHNMV